MADIESYSFEKCTTRRGKSFAIDRDENSNLGLSVDVEPITSRKRTSFFNKMPEKCYLAIQTTETTFRFYPFQQGEIDRMLEILKACTEMDPLGEVDYVNEALVSFL
jgi:hypothetical protein